MTTSDRASSCIVLATRKWRGKSGQQILDHLCRLAAGEALVEALMLYAETLVVEAEQVQNRRVEVANVDRVFDDVVAEVVGLAVDGTGASTAAGHPHGETPRVVVAAVVGLAQPA